MKTPKGFNRTKNRANKYINDKEKADELINDAIKKANKNQNKLDKVWDDLQTLIRMSKSWIKGDYRKIPNRTVLLMITAVLYFVNPLDIVPDFLFISGFFDDATILGFVIKSIKDDIDDYKIWENSSKKQD